ncbi:MAG: glutaredoxin family protein [Deltaproteobacteria bacterium]|nr:glutaredoxin family protein [Deltaproteobacteria bacterium]MBW1846878.1 glutaredoxin family protein [Deltaproteobacteria bacterium]MBW1985090.1 glutaredoxin family protein [Deltaproteobacteria bacterium]MBW2179999.1 glutaredoxin family protein [Deltaproteobacteria bacterium]MBW2365791.1 glutaredoxin family protein [Deltaproteobacteria bacterium]
MNDQNVQIFTLSTCGHCKSTKKFLEKYSVNYDCVDVDLLDRDQQKEILENIKILNPKLSFPTIVIGDKVIVGYKENEIKEALGL